MGQLSNKELNRYSRQMILPEVGTKGQLKIKNSKVLVIGAGGLGCPILLYLASAGIGTLGIIDFDEVDYSNLHRQILYNPQDVGKFKAEIASQKVAALNPEITINTYNTQLNTSNVFDIFKPYDIIVDGSDNFPTRYMVSDATVILNKPLVFGAVNQFTGQASVFNYKDGPTYRCLFPEQPKSGEVPSCATAGVLGVLPGIIGSIQANETLKIILDKGDTLSGRFLQIDALNFQVDIINVSRDEDYANIESLGEYEENCSYNVNSLSPYDFDTQYMLNDFEIYDMRPPNQFEVFNIGGNNVPPEELLNHPEKLPKDKSILLICQLGEQSEAIAEYLHEQGFSQVYNLTGGIYEWLIKINKEDI